MSAARKQPLAVSRREAIFAAAVGGGLLVGWRGIAAAGAAKAAEAAAVPVNAWVRIAPDGDISVLVNCSEMGQGSQTGFAQIVADELDADWSQVRVEQAPVEKVYFNAWDIYSTGGSGSIRNHVDKLRAVGASARAMLVEAAAARWGIAAADCHAERGRVVHGPTRRSLGFGELAAEAAKLEPPAKPPLKPREAWRYMGKPVARLDLPSKVDGSAIYGVDVRMPGLLVATIAQCPVSGGTLVSVDDTPALQVAGVRRVVRLDNAVAVVADGFWQAKSGLEKLQPQWDFGKLAGVSSSDISKGLAEAARNAATAYVPEGGDEIALRGAASRALAAAPRRVEATYEAPMLSHSPLEPMNGTAWVHADRAELWVPTQVQSELRADVAKAIGLPEDKVTVNTTQLGGGFGRRLKTDYGVQAALVAKAVGGPVKLIWTREEDTRHGFYRPAAVAHLEAGVGVDGLPVAFTAKIGCLDTNPYSGLVHTPYDLPNAAALSTTWNPGVPIGAWRSVDQSQNVFFLESFIDELALAAGADAVAYRHQLLAGNPRMRRVLAAAAEAAGWGRPPAGRHQGVALAHGWGTSCVQIAEVSVQRGDPAVHRIVCAIDCGTAINPVQIRAQVESGVTIALGAALAQEITLSDGRVEQGNFDTLPMPQMERMPEVETVILESPSEKVGGIGEPPVPPLAPAICNALFAATGKRIRKLPIAAQLA